MKQTKEPTIEDLIETCQQHIKETNPRFHTCWLDKYERNRCLYTKEYRLISHEYCICQRNGEYNPNPPPIIESKELL